jgi:hypothetical protein
MKSAGISGIKREKELMNFQKILRKRKFGAWDPSR